MGFKCTCVLVRDLGRQSVEIQPPLLSDWNLLPHILQQLKIDITIYNVLFLTGLGNHLTPVCVCACVCVCVCVRVCECVCV